jgi:hypothetical protein
MNCKLWYKLFGFLGHELWKGLTGQFWLVVSYTVVIEVVGVKNEVLSDLSKWVSLDIFSG